MATVTGVVAMSSSTTMTISGHVYPRYPTLFDQISALEGQDPLMVGATGYLDDVFPMRLVGDSE